jgi:hypothetical protein
LWVEPATTDRVSRRSIIYVDGFNLYYGAVRGTPHKWLDLEKYFRFVRKDDEIIAIRYFTAMVQGPGRLRQREYLRALATLPLVTVYEGRFRRRSSSAASRRAPMTAIDVTQASRRSAPMSASPWR